MVVRGLPEDLADHPGLLSGPLIIEIADTSLSRDRGIKKRIYARTAVAEYWVPTRI